MPLVSSCPQCRKALAIADNLAGQKVRCPHCQTVYQAPTAAGPPAAVPPSRPVAPPLPPPVLRPAAPPPSPPVLRPVAPPPAPIAQEVSGPVESAPMATFPDPAPQGSPAWDRLSAPGVSPGYPAPARDDFAGQHPLARDSDLRGFGLSNQNWDLFRLGVQITSYGMVAIVVLQSINMLLGFFMASSGGRVDSSGAQMVGICILVFLGLAALVYLGGVFTCIAIPAQTGGRTFVIAGDSAIGIGSLFIVIGFIAVTLSAISNPYGSQSSRSFAGLLLIAGFGIAIIGKILFLIGMRSAAVYVRDQNLAKGIVVYLIGGMGVPIFLSVVLFCLLIGSLMGTQSTRDVGYQVITFFVVVMVMVVASAVWQFVLLQQLNIAVKRGVARMQRDSGDDDGGRPSYSEPDWT